MNLNWRRPRKRDRSVRSTRFASASLRENALEARPRPGFQESPTRRRPGEFQRAAVREVVMSTDETASDEVLSLIGELTGRLVYGSTGPYDMAPGASGPRGLGLTSEARV